jgi:hypothetical protein
MKAARRMAHERWAIKEVCTNKLDGHREWFHWSGTAPLLFATKRQASSYIKEKYGHRHRRPDLRKEPFCWRMPKPVKVRVELHEVRHD